MPSLYAILIHHHTHYTHCKKIRNFCYEKKKNENHKSDWNSCNYFKADGSDNGYTSYIKNHFDWHVMFVGQYSVGDISYVGLKSVNNAHG